MVNKQSNGMFNKTEEDINRLYRYMLEHHWLEVNSVSAEYFMSPIENRLAEILKRVIKTLEDR